MNKIKGESIERLNAGLMIAACVASFIAPFHVFLFAYAVLGPLHYLTEISWLHDHDYFAPRRAPERPFLRLKSRYAVIASGDDARAASGFAA